MSSASDVSWGRSGAAGAVREILLIRVLGLLIGLCMRRRIAGRHSIAVHFAPAVRPDQDEDRIEAMERIRPFFEAAGAVTTRDKRMAARRGSVSPSG